MSEQHSPGPWWPTDSGVRNSGGYIAHTNPVSRYEGQDERYAREVAQRGADRRLIAAAPELKSLADNFEITGPDDDGLLWLVLHGGGTTGKAMFNLGRAIGVAGQVALLLEQDRRAAIAKAEGGGT